jgi:glycolate oxidase FAD binding subunit
MAQPVEVSGAVHLQAPVAARLNHPGLKTLNKSVTALRLENFSSAVAGRKQRLKEALKVYGKAGPQAGGCHQAVHAGRGVL